MTQDIWDAINELRNKLQMSHEQIGLNINPNWKPSFLYEEIKRVEQRLIKRIDSLENPVGCGDVERIAMDKEIERLKEQLSIRFEADRINKDNVDSLISRLEEKQREIDELQNKVSFTSATIKFDKILNERIGCLEKELAEAKKNLDFYYKATINETVRDLQIINENKKLREELAEAKEELNVQVVERGVWKDHAQKLEKELAEAKEQVKKELKISLDERTKLQTEINKLYEENYFVKNLEKQLAEAKEVIAIEHLNWEGAARVRDSLGKQLAEANANSVKDAAELCNLGVKLAAANADVTNVRKESAANKKYWMETKEQLAAANAALEKAQTSETNCFDDYQRARNDAANWEGRYLAVTQDKPVEYEVEKLLFCPVIENNLTVGDVARICALLKQHGRVLVILKK